MSELMKLLDELEEKFLMEAAEQNKLKPYLDKKAWEIFKVDQRIKYLEEDKNKLLNEMRDLLEMGTESTHTLNNGFKIMPDNRYRITVKDFSTFMKWLKESNSPKVIMDFLEDGLKVATIKRFCEREVNKQRVAGEMEPKIPGIILGEKTYTKLKTEMIKNGTGKADGSRSKNFRANKKAKR